MGPADFGSTHVSNAFRNHAAAQNYTGYYTRDEDWRALAYEEQAQFERAVKKGMSFKTHQWLLDWRDRPDAKLRVKSVLDIGANGGWWASRTAKVFPSAKFFLIEANARHKPSLSRRCKLTGSDFIPGSCAYTIALVGANDGDNVTFYTSHRDRITPKGGSIGGASMFREVTPSRNPIHSEANVIRTTLPLRTIDSLVALSSKQIGTQFDLIKLDIQGAELPALLGARNTLKAADLLWIELSLLPSNENSPLLFEVMAVLRSMRFLACELTEQQHDKRRHVLVQMTMVFCRMDSYVLTKKATGYRQPDRILQDLYRPAFEAYARAISDLKKEVDEADGQRLVV